MRLKFEKVVVVDFFAGRFGEKARLIKNEKRIIVPHPLRYSLFFNFLHPELTFTG